MTVPLLTWLCGLLSNCKKVAMAKAGSCMFRVGYFLYTRTRIGYYYHQKEIRKSREKLQGAPHSECEATEFGELSILPVPMLLDNYAYIVTDRGSNMTVVVDPGDAEPVQKVLSDLNITPEAILLTHKHWDHSGGNQAMKSRYPNVRVYGGGLDHVPNITNEVSDGAVLEFGGLKFSAMFTPGHTVGHLVYRLHGDHFNAPDSLFSGDHIFLGGCGRMFEGSPATMLHSLDKVCQLGDTTLVWPGHEYASANLEFACDLDSGNMNAQNKLSWVKSQREKKLPTCPSSMKEERSYNPFLRTGERSLLDAMGVECGDVTRVVSDDTRAQALAELRELKDKFKYQL